jgi:thiamine-monophosphate kinase
MDEPAETTSIAELGEFGLIKRIQEQIGEPRFDSTLLGMGDDAAVLDYGEEKTVVSSDCLVEGVHFDLTYVPLKHLGYKAAVVNISDILAMNAEPQHLTVSLALSNRYTVEAVDAIYEGIALACQNYDLDLVGGDTTSALYGSMIAVTALGKVKKGEEVRRSGAKENDVLMVSGDLGGAYMGLQLLEREKEAFKSSRGEVQPDLEGYDYILERQLKPEARKDALRALRENEVQPTSMIDVSDGLASDLLHICDRSAVGTELYEEHIPIDQKTYDTARDFDLDPTVCALSGGEDYELLFTIDPKEHEKLQNHPDFTAIGHMKEKAAGNYLTTRNNRSVELTAQGWDALLRSEKGEK